MSSRHCICDSRSQGRTGLDKQIEMLSVCVRNVKPWRLQRSSQERAEKKEKAQVDSRKIFM